MEFEQEEPVSPTGLYMSSSALSLTTLGFLEFQVPIDDLQVFDLIKDLFLPINPRFSSIMVLFYSLFKFTQTVNILIILILYHICFQIF